MIMVWLSLTFLFAIKILLVWRLFVVFCVVSLFVCSNLDYANSGWVMCIFLYYWKPLLGILLVAWNFFLGFYRYSFSKKLTAKIEYLLFTWVACLCVAPDNYMVRLLSRVCLVMQSSVNSINALHLFRRSETPPVTSCASYWFIYIILNRWLVAYVVSD